MTLGLTLTETAVAIPSAQDSDGVPRFFVPPDAGHGAWKMAADAEARGGVSAEVRVFLDAQLEAGDVVLDLDPGFGFVALSAATAPRGVSAVFVAGVSRERLLLLQDAAADAGGWLEAVDWPDEVDLSDLLDTRLDTDGRVIVHAAAAQVRLLCERLHSMLATGRVLAICVSDAAVAAADGDAWSVAQAALQAVGMSCGSVAERDGDVVLLPMVGPPASAVIALPTGLVSQGIPADEAHGFELAPCDEVFPVAFRDPAAACPRVEPFVSQPVPGTADMRWSPRREGLSLIAPHSRTGYGIAGAHLLRALQELPVPVAFFPLGPVDRTLTDNPHLSAALARQGSFSDGAPSVRLSQQFDLAMHVGRGPRIGFTIFELDTFSERERHHLHRQDAIVVCTEWARQVCLANGITETPVHVVPLGVDRSIFNETVTATARSSDTVFLQVGKLEPRKGQLELLRAFEDAFTPRDSVRLVFACANPFVTRVDMEAMLRPFTSSRMASRITMVTTELGSQLDVARLMASASCGVFAARAEGWNLEALEMLSMGRHVIATDCTGHSAYLNRENALPITVDRWERAHSGAALGQWAAWGASQHEQLVAHLRDVHARRTSGALSCNDAGIATAVSLSWKAAAEALLRALATVG
jgi:glycosyltransferase involved in cell wall biosynthesis